jgi:hypothetical protein
MRTISPSVVETFDYRITENGVGVIDVAMKIYIQRVSDSKWWKHSVLDWDAAVTANDMTEVDSTNLKGLHQYLSLPVNKMAAGDRYRVRYYSATAGYEVDESEIVGVEASSAPVGMALEATLNIMQNKAGSSGFDRTTDSLEALQELAVANQVLVSKEATVAKEAAATTNRLTLMSEFDRIQSVTAGGFDRDTDSLQALRDKINTGIPVSGVINANIVSIKGSEAETPAKLLSDLETIMNGIDDLMTGEIE